MSAFEQAVRSTVTALATTTHLVKVTNWEPLVYSPANLLNMTLGNVGISTPESIATFQAALAALLPNVATGIQDQDLNSNVTILLIVNYVEALLLAS